MSLCPQRAHSPPCFGQLVTVFPAFAVLIIAGTCHGRGSQQPRPVQSQTAARGSNDSRKSVERDHKYAERSPAESSFEGDVYDPHDPPPVSLEVGGSIRTRFEYQDDFDFDESSGEDQDFALLRTRLDFDVGLPWNLSSFIQLQYADIFGEDETAVTSTDGVDIHQGYLEVRKLGETPIVGRFGRQELRYGKMRLIGAPNWRTNVGRHFDAGKIWYEMDSLRADLFVAKYDPPSGGDQSVAGLYSVLTSIPDHKVEPYLLLKRDRSDEAVTGEDGEEGDLRVYTVGLRADGKKNQLDYEGEASYQFGDRANDDICAYALACVLGYTWDAELRPRLAIEYNMASGDQDPDDNTYQTFDHLYPAHHFRFGYMDLVGCRNIRNLRITAELRPNSKLCLSGDYHFFWLDDTADSLYKLNGVVSRAGDPVADREVGQELDLTVRYDADKHTQFMAGYSHFFAGDFLSDTGSADDADWVYMQMLLHF